VNANLSSLTIHVRGLMAEGCRLLGGRGKVMKNEQPDEHRIDAIKQIGNPADYAQSITGLHEMELDAAHTQRMKKTEAQQKGEHSEPAKGKVDD
jgi:hypothetical protein